MSDMEINSIAQGDPVTNMTSSGRKTLQEVTNSLPCESCKYSVVGVYPGTSLLITWVQRYGAPDLKRQIEAPPPHTHPFCLS